MECRQGSVIQDKNGAHWYKFKHDVTRHCSHLLLLSNLAFHLHTIIQSWILCDYILGSIFSTVVCVCVAVALCFCLYPSLTNITFPLSPLLPFTWMHSIQNILNFPINIQQERTPNICGSEYILWVRIIEFQSYRKNPLVSQLRKANLTSLKSRGPIVTVSELESRSSDSHLCPFSIDFVSLWSCPEPASHGFLCELVDGW